MSVSMKLTTKQIQNIVQGMTLVSQEIQSGRLKLEVGTSMTLAVAKKTLAPIYEAYTEAREDLLNQLVVKDEKGQKVKIPAVKDANGNIVMHEQWDLGGRDEEWRNEVKGLLTKEYEFDRLDPLPMAQFKMKKVKGA